MTLIQKIKSVTSRQELREALSSSSIEVRQIMLTNAIELLNKEIECDITEGNIDIALFKMSQVVMLEDELHIVERLILKQRVIAK